MRKLMFVAALVVCVLPAVRAAQQNPEQYAGVWSGSWEGAGSGGGFELTLDKPKDGTMAGRVSVTGDPTYKAELNSLTFDGAKMTAKYDFVLDDSAEVVLTGTFDGKSVSGAWSVRQKGTTEDAISGTWKASRQ